jgi:hypothetical protein
VWADDAASRLEEGRKILLDELINNLLQQNAKLTQSAAERLARTSAAFKAHVKAMHDARTQANLKKVEMLNLDRIYWQGVSQEATARSERKMG